MSWSVEQKEAIREQLDKLIKEIAEKSFRQGREVERNSSYIWTSIEQSAVDFYKEETLEVLEAITKGEQ